MSLIMGQRKKAPAVTSILASDLMPDTVFDASQTIPAMNINTQQYDSNMATYLQMLGVTEIDREYNEAVKQFENTLQEQELSAKLQANLQMDTLANRAVESQPGLGTGAAAIASEGRQAQLSQQHEQIEANVAEAYASGLSELSEGYLSALESKLGKYDATTGTFEGLAEYEAMSDAVTSATAKVLARLLNPDIDTLSDDYLMTLRDAGYIELGADNSVMFTEKGLYYIDAIVNSQAVNEANAFLGDSTFARAIAEEMAKADYLLQPGETGWDNLSETKRDEIILEYSSWIYNNQDSLRITAWNLYNRENGQVVLDTIFELPELATSVSGVKTDSGVLLLEVDELPGYSSEEISTVKKKVMSGEIPDGSYITFRAGTVTDSDKYYYVENGVLYSTDYTSTDPPPVINLASATVQSFGHFWDAGAGVNKQDSWVNAILSAAKSGKIPDGTYINMNFGRVASDAANRSLYQYRNGAFYRVHNASISAEGMFSNGDSGLMAMQFSATGVQNTFTTVATFIVDNKEVESISAGETIFWINVESHSAEKYIDW